MGTATKSGNLFGTEAQFSQRTEVIEMATVTEKPSANGALATQSQPPANPMAIIQVAIERGVDADQLGKLMDLQERFERNRAAEAFGAAISRFQKICPRIHKGRKVQGGGLNYQYASFDDVMAQAGPHLAACGIALSFSTEANDRGIRVTIRVRVGIHAEDSTLDVPVPDMKVNSTQRYGAALSYAKRYALCAALNIVVTDEDDDATSAYDPVTDDQSFQLDEAMTLLVEKYGESERGRFLKWMGVERLADIPSRDFQKAIQALRGKLNASR